MMELSNAALASLPDAVATPRYDRKALRSGIVHIGVGHFHRSHQAVYLDELMRRGAAMDWAICGAGVCPGAATRDALVAQDYLYNVDGQGTRR